MFKNYFMTAIRSIFKNKLHSMVNIGGLGIALGVCLVMFMFVYDELSVDTWIEGAENIYISEADLQIPGQAPMHFANTPGRWKETLTPYLANEVENMSRVFRDYHRVENNEGFNDETVIYADPEFSDIFDFEMVTGNFSDAFKDNSSIIISELIAEKYYGSSDPIGQTLYFEDEDTTFSVVGVMKNLPSNTTFDIDFLAKFVDERYVDRPWIATNWVSHNVVMYYKLREGVTPEQVEARFPDYMDSHIDLSNMGMGDAKVSNFETISLTNLLDIHLYSQGGFRANGDIMVVYAFSGIAALILLIAGINFMNLSTARSVLRAKEIGVRKALGARRKQLITQFLGEALLTTVLALLIAIILATLALPWFNEIVTKVLEINVFTDPILMLGLGGVVAIVGLGAGMYPALHMSSYRPREVLSGNKSQGANQSSFRTFLVTFQFAISIGLIVVTAVIFSQINYARSLDIGIDKNNVRLLFNLNQPDKVPANETLIQEIGALPSVEAVSMTNRSLPLNGDNFTKFNLEGTGPEDALFMDRIIGDYNYLQFYGAKLLAGRFFSKDFQGDLPQIDPETGEVGSQGAIINETALRKFGFQSPEEAIGQYLSVLGGNGQEPVQVKTEIVGVVADMKLRSLREDYESLVFYVQDSDLGIMNIRFKEGENQAGLQSVTNTMSALAPEYEMSGQDLEERIARQYNNDEERARIFAYFSGFALFISALGLFGMATYSVERRTQEIGIRKVHGASLKAIVTLLVMQFSKPVMVANIIAWPVAYYFLNDWLQEFAFRITLHPGYFIVAGVVALLIAWATVGTQAFKVARTNPIHALRYE